jgi:hypothetical protein
MTGKWFIQKRLCHSVSKWTLLEEIILTQLLHGHMSSNSDIDVALIHLQYLEFVDNKDILPKSVRQIMGKIVSCLNDNEVFQVLSREQLRLNL